MKDKIQSLTDAALEKFCKQQNVALPKNFSYQTTVPKDKQFGDFSVNVAFRLAKIAKQAPAQIAKELIEILRQDMQSNKDLKGAITKVDLAAGYINFHASTEAMSSIVMRVRKEGKKFGCSDFGQKKKVLVEFVSANPTGPLTIAHGRQACVGDALVRVLTAAGFCADAEYYLNDRGRQMMLLGKSVWARYQQQQGKKCDLPEDGYQGDYINDLAKEAGQKYATKIQSISEDEACELMRQFAQEKIMNQIKDDLREIDVYFTHYQSEKKLFEEKKIEKALEVLQKKKMIYDQDGAQWFESTKFGDDKNRVLKKSDGDYTYLMPDIAYHQDKIARGYEQLVNLWGPDHHGYVARIKASIEALGHKKEQLHVILVQLTTLYRKGKPFRMSTRKGQFITLKELINEVGADATRFFFLMRRTDTHLDFDLELAKQKSQDNPVYYLQYAHARICNVIKFAEQNVPDQANLSSLNAPEEMDVLKLLSKFPEVVISAANQYEPFVIGDFLRTLAAAFHKFYTFHRVVSDNQEQTQARLMLVDAVRIVLANGLALLGVSQPESM